MTRGTLDLGAWCILRCSNGKTLELAASLTDAGFEAWSPVEVRMRLAGRKRGLVEQAVPILPAGYVFAPYRYVGELLALSHSPTLNYQVWDSGKRRMVTKGHPYFTVFRMNGVIRAEPDAGLRSLRALEASLAEAAERRREAIKQKGPVPRFEEGQTVRVVGAGFDGLDLRVAESNDGKLVKLQHPSWMWEVEISAWKLQEVQVKDQSPEQAAAQAA
jgi:hypothetical protein